MIGLQPHDRVTVNTSKEYGVHGMAKKKGPASGIKSTYNKKKKELTIKFRNGTWTYEDIPVKTGRAMTNARSQGRFFNARIRDNYDGDNR